MNNLPIYVYLVFGTMVFSGLFLFVKATGYSKKTLIILTAWLVFQAVVALTGFYQNTMTMPPRIALMVIPPLIFITRLFLTKSGRSFIDSLDVKMLTFLHILRLPIEIVLFWLFLNKGVPELMTFEGRNLDILSGITAPFIYYFGFIKQSLSKKIILAWNFLGLILLANIVFHAILSVPTVFQQFAFDQPNIAITFFPFNLLPALLVQLVLFSHLTTIRQLLRKEF